MATVECRSCTGDSDLFLCRECVAELRAALESLAFGAKVNGRVTMGLLEALDDVRLKMTCMPKEAGRHRKRGDELAALFEPDTERGKPTRQGQASKLLHAARNILTTIVRDLLESRKISPDKAFQVVSPKDFIGPLLPGWRRVPSGWQPTTAEVARWLATHVHALACDEGAGVWKRDVGSLVARIKRVIDRPPAPRFCGQCDTMLTDENGRRKMCGVGIYAPRDVVEVVCPNRKCRTVHNVEKLYTRTINSADQKNFPRKILLGIMRDLETPLSADTFDRYVRDGHLRPKMFLRPCGHCAQCAVKVRYLCEKGRRGFFRHGPEDVPEYKLEDLRNIKRRMESNQKAGRAKTVRA